MAQQSVAGQLEGIPFSGHLGTDGLWARLRGGAKRVVLILVVDMAKPVWAIYHNFTPAKRRCERKRHYQRPGQIEDAALPRSFEVARYHPGGISYLDALSV